MATGRVQDICGTMKKFIESMKKEIKRKEDDDPEAAGAAPEADRSATSRFGDGTRNSR